MLLLWRHIDTEPVSKIGQYARINKTDNRGRYKREDGSIETIKQNLSRKEAVPLKGSCGKNTSWA